LRWSIHYQTLPEGVDYHERYYKTCENGDAHPTLPFFRWEFSRSKTPPFNEIIDFVLDYRLFVAPSIENTDTWELLKDFGFPVSGPYCYAGELRGYTFDFQIDSKEGSDYFQIEHACIEGEPCLSKAFQRCSDCTEIEVRESSGGSEVQVGVVIWLILSISIIGAFCLCSCFNNIRQKKRINELAAEVGTMGTVLSMRENDETYALMENEDPNANVLHEPILTAQDEFNDDSRKPETALTSLCSENDVI